MTMIHEGATQYETDTSIRRVLEEVVREHGKTNDRVARFAIVLDQVYVSTRTPAEKKTRKVKKAPPRNGGEVDAALEAEQQSAVALKKPAHLAVCRWIKPQPSVQAHMSAAKLGKGQALFLEVRTDLWVLMSDRDRKAALLTALLQREVVDQGDGSYKVRKAELPIQTHPCVQEAYGPWWENMDCESGGES